MKAKSHAFSLIRHGLKKGMRFARTPDGSLWRYSAGTASPLELQAAYRHGTELEAVLAEKEFVDCCEEVDWPEWRPIYLPCLLCLTTSHYRLVDVGWRDSRFVSLAWRCQHDLAWLAVRAELADELNLSSLQKVL